MKKVFLSITAILLSVCCMAQAQMAFPFQGGQTVMDQFFKENLIASADIIQQKATGMVLFKFTADLKGKITKMIVYYADDPVLVSPVIEALKKSNHKWIIPDYEKSHDFIIPVSFNLNAPKTDSLNIAKPFFETYRNRKPIFSTNQVPLDRATFLPAVMVYYDVSP